MSKPSRAVLGVVVLFAVIGAVLYAARVGPFAGAPEQPIAFPHDLHAGKSQIPCMYCHYTADVSPDAGIPSVATCVGCHMPGGVPLVRADSLGVRQLALYWREQQPIPWVRIHKVPDHVHFPHMMHVKAGVECQECHGLVEEMVEVEQFASLRMGWCVNCHREREARTDCFVCHY